MDWVSGIPYGLLLCRLNGESVTVTALTDEKLRVRRMGDEPIRSLELRFLKSDLWGYAALSPKGWRAEPAKNGVYGSAVEIEIDDSRFRDEVRRILRLYARYIRVKGEGDDEYAASALTGCPYEDAEASSLDEQKRKWFSGVEGFSLGGDWTLALAVDRPEKYREFMRLPFYEFQKRYFAANHLENHALFQTRAKRVYIGNAFCVRLNPDISMLAALFGKARAEGLDVTPVLPFLRESDVAWGAERIRHIAALGADEIQANDLGAIALIHPLGIPIALGVLLNRRRKDPRAAWKSGWSDAGGLLSENSLNDAAYRGWLAAHGVSRIEYEAAGAPVALAAGKSSVHFPFYVTNTSHFCPLAAACMGRDPGRPVAECGRVCEDYARLYPDWMRTVGRYNSIFGCDLTSVTDSGVLRAFLAQGADRLVADLL